ncbi:MAG TPA: DUF2723 domain-containing protein [Myxococcota bacterium]|nr:DUF2723 domain-containing protein [Myxococcota bacterium]
MRLRLPLKVLLPLAAMIALAVCLLVFNTVFALLLIVLVTVFTLIGGATVRHAALADSGVNGAPRLLVKGTDRFVLTWVLVTALLWTFCAPDVYFRDAGELTGAAVNLGVPHPTGFPLLCMLGKLFSLFPAGNVYFRFNLLSGFAAGGAAAFLSLYFERQFASRRSGQAGVWWVGPLIYLGSAAAWLHGTTPEIYSISLLGMLVTIFLALEATRANDARLLVASAVLAGLGLGGHVTWPLYSLPVVAVALAVFSFRAGAGQRARTLFRAGFLSLFAFVIGAMVVFYLVSAASRDPLMNWGDPSTFKGLLAHLSGQRIRDSFAGRMTSLNPAVLSVNLSLAIRSLWDSLGPVLPFVFVGALHAILRRSWWTTSILALVLADLVFAVFINPMGIRDLQVLLTATWGLALLAASGASLAVDFLGRRGGAPGAIAMIGLVCISLVFQWVASPADRDMRNLYGGRVISDILLDKAGSGAVAMTASDDMSALFMARTAVEDARPDMVFLVKQHLSDTRYVLRRLNPLNLENPGVVRGAVMDRVRERHFEAGGETPEVSLRRAVALFSLLGPVHVEPGEGVADAAIEDRLVPGFPLWPVTDSVTSLQRSEAAADWRRALGLRHLVDRWGRAFLAEWIRLYGTREARLGQDALAIPVLRSALVVDPDDFRAAHNLAVLLAASGDRDTALDLLMSSVSINPGYVKGWETLFSTAAAAGRDTIARDAASRAAALRPAR